jgi:hypothetical protein
MSAPHSPLQSQRAPREHGFWVMLLLALGAGVALGPSARGLGAALAVGLGAIGGASLVGRRIRKNAPLQTFAAAGLGASAGAVAALGGAELAGAARLGAVLALAFVAGALAVRAVLERARRQPEAARRLAAAGALLPALGAAGLWVSGGTSAQSAALGVTALYCGAVALAAPSAKRLRLLGLTIALAHLLTATLAVL